MHVIGLFYEKTQAQFAKSLAGIFLSPTGTGNNKLYPRRNVCEYYCANCRVLFHINYM